jgi:hypothetical protein
MNINGMFYHHLMESAKSEFFIGQISDDGEWKWDGESWIKTHDNAEYTPPHVVTDSSNKYAGTESKESQNPPLGSNLLLTKPYLLFETKDALYIIASVLIPITMLYYFRANYSDDEPFRHLEGHFVPIMLVFVCFCLVGYAFALRVRIGRNEDKLILGLVLAACIFWAGISNGPSTYYMIIASIIVGFLALSLYEPKSRNMIPIISIFILWLATQNNGALMSGGSQSSLFGLWDNWQYNYDADSISVTGMTIVRPLQDIFFLTALTPALCPKSNIKSSIPDSPSGDYVSIGEATEAVLPALLVIMMSGSIGLIFIYSGVEESFASLMCGIMILCFGIVIAQFKLLADAINRGIRTANQKPD